MNPVKRVLGALGKSETKIAAVFALTAEGAARAVAHVQAGTSLPVWLFTHVPPDAETAAACAHVIIAERLWWRGQQELWPYWTALCTGEWTGSRGRWSTKLAPLSIPPFRALILNENGDFFSGAALFTHIQRRAMERTRAALFRLGDLSKGAALFCFAFVAQWNSALSRFAFERLRGTRALPLTTAPEGEGIAHYPYSGREWNHKAIARITGARLVLFEQSGAVWPVADDLLPLFNDPATFAVSRQTGCRNWRKLLFATAPFRALQPGEATRVLAPVSGQILVDCAKLAALGIPALSSFGANWYLLFWQAAAAGWKSYSAGNVTTPGELPAVPFDEAEFVKTLLAEPALAVLMPNEPNLARGTIVQSTRHRPQFRGLPRVLVVSPYLPYPLSHGGAVRIYNLCRALSPRVDFVLACFREKGDITDYGKLFEVFRDVHVVDIDERNQPIAGLPKQVSEYGTASMRALIASVECDLLQIEYTQMAAYREAAPTVPAILVEHDLTFTLHRQLAEREPRNRAEADAWYRFETERLRAFDAVWTMSELDRERAITEGSPADATFAIPNGVDLRRFTCAPKTTPGDEILYVGSFRHLPNYLGFEELRSTILPAVWKRFPDVRLRVVAGPDHEKHWPGAHTLDKRITVHGFVENLLPLYTEATLVVVPLPISAGTNIKLMEALACARAVVTTPVGCAGLGLTDGDDVLIRELGVPFVEGIQSLLENVALREATASQGRLIAEQRFSWDSIADAAYASYRTMRKERFSG